MGVMALVGGTNRVDYSSEGCSAESKATVDEKARQGAKFFEAALLL
jgi:hypothetical protein